MNGNTVFTVPTDRQAITIRLSQGVAVEGEIFLESLTDGYSTHQKMIAFLENSNDFFPIKLTATGGTEFMLKRNVWAIEVRFPQGTESAYFAHLLMHTIPVVAHFCDNTTVAGDLTAEVPKEKARLSDCLNMTNRFLSVRTVESMCYISKDALQKVVHAAT